MAVRKMIRAGMIAAVVAAWIAAGAEAEIGTTERGTVTASQEVYAATPDAEAFVPPSKGFHWTMATIEEQPAYTVHLLMFPSPLESPAPCNNTVFGEYFRPNVKGKIPAVVVLHVAGGDFTLFRFVSQQLAVKGVGALFVQMAYYGSRRPTDNPRLRMLSADMDMTYNAVRQTLMDVKRAALWLSLRPEVDTDRIGVLGASLGALVGSVAAGVEPRFTRSAFVVGGGDLARIIWESRLTVREKKILEGRGYTLELLREKIWMVDPLRYAKHINPQTALMVNARYDRVIPPACTEELWKTMGRPPIVWYEAGHETILSYLFEIVNKVTDHFGPATWKAAK